MIPESEALDLSALIAPGATANGMASRVLARSEGGNVTLFAFETGHGLGEHTPAFDALAIVLDGEVTFTIGDQAVQASAGTVVRLPASVPHAAEATEASRMLFIMLREVPAGP